VDFHSLFTPGALAVAPNKKVQLAFDSNSESLTVGIANKMLSYRGETALQGAL